MAQLVIAHYNEPLDWLTVNFFRNIDILIYEKGDASKGQLTPNQIALPNIGREAHTYLTHIVNNYDNLAQLTIFSQGMWQDHVFNIWQSIGICGDKGFSDFAHLRIHMCFNETSRQDMRRRNPWSKYINTPSPALIALFQEIFPNQSLPDWIEFGANAIFSVRRDIIHRHPRDLYIRLLSHFDPEKRSSEYINSMAYTLEYFWKILFVYNVEPEN